MKKCNECGQIINAEMYQDIISKVRRRKFKNRRINNNNSELEILGKIFNKIKEELFNNPEKIKKLTDDLVNDLKNKENKEQE